MTAGRMSAALATTLASGCSCGLSHTVQRDAAPDVSDAGGDVVVGDMRDAETGLSDAGGPWNECVSNIELGREFVLFAVDDRSCGLEQQAACRHAVASLAGGAVAMCVRGLPLCFNADHCPYEGPPWCLCGETQCTADEVCVSDGTAAAHCEALCLREHPTGRACSGEVTAIPSALVPGASTCDALAERKCQLWAQTLTTVRLYDDLGATLGVASAEVDVEDYEECSVVCSRGSADLGTIGPP